MNQDEVFKEEEGDAWFHRNKEALTSEALWEKDPVLRLITETRLAPANILEVGAANGFRLATLQHRFNIPVTAVEPSERAIADGRLRFPEIGFLRGEARDLSILGGKAFDLVIVNFVLHWLDRAGLFRSIANIDNAVCDWGFLIIGDFFPDSPERTAYHHRPDLDLWTYKQDYCSFFLASGLYREIAAHVFHHGTGVMGDDIPSVHRARVGLLVKSLRNGYKVRKIQ